MTDNDPSLILMQGAAVWNLWRAQNPQQINFAAPHWYDSPGRGGVQVKGPNRLNFSGMNLSGTSIYRAFAEGLNLRDSLFENAHFEEGDFSRADFSGAVFRSTKFNKTIFTGAVFDGATFINCNLNRVNLAEASFKVKEITETVVYGLSAWDLKMSDESKQSKLVIEKTYELYSDLIAQGQIPMMVDDIELAQFVHYLGDHKKMRDTLNILNERGVLLLGRFKGGGLERLYTIREWLQRRGYMAMIFDFARPESLSRTETVITMAGLAKFVIADLSGPSVGQELTSILAGIKKPVLVFGAQSTQGGGIDFLKNLEKQMKTQMQTPVFASGAPTALSGDLADNTGSQMIQVDESNLLESLDKRLSELEQIHAERIAQLAQRYTKSARPQERTVERATP